MRSNGASRPERWLPGTTAVGPSASVQSCNRMCAPIANTGYGMRSSHGTPSGARNVRPGVGVPEAAGELGRVPPRGVGDHVAVVAEQRLDRLEDPRMPDRALARRAAVEHLVAELVLVVADPLGRDRVEHAVDLGAQLGHLGGGEHAAQHGAAVALELDAGLGRVARDTP